jgi:hypothetical protein
MVDAKKNLKWLTVHNYAATICDRETVSVERLLSPELMAEGNRGPGVPYALGQAGVWGLMPLLDVARGSGLPMAMAEANSVSCGGMPGVSNAFAAALWGLDYTFSLAQDGFINVDFQTSYRPGGSSYNPIDTYGTETAPGIWKYRNVAEPLYYGLYLFSQNAAGAHLLAATTESHANIHAYAVSRCPSCAVKIFIINKDMKAAGLVRVRLDRNMGPGTLLLLDAPGLESLAADVRYGGQQFNSDGVIAAPTTKTVVPDAQGNYDFTLPNAAAAVLTVEPTM